MSTLAQIGVHRPKLAVPVQKRVLLRVYPVEGEATRFYCESGSLQCTECGKLFNRRLDKNRRLQVGAPCPSKLTVVSGA